MFRRHGHGRDIAHRWEGNPLIRIEDMDFMCADVRCAGVALYNEETILLVTIEHLSGQQSIHLARTDGRQTFHLDKNPFLAPIAEGPDAQHEVWGVMDARVTVMDGIYYIMYLAYGKHGYRIGLATTKDFQSVERVGLISEPDTKGGTLFPVKFNGRYARLERPQQGHAVWLSYSDDLRHWGDSKRVMAPRFGYWDNTRIGAGAPPMLIDEGWLVIYYGVKDTSSGPLFRLGSVILDRNDPSKVVGRSNIPILAPREKYERIGDIPNLVYSTGAFIDSDGKIHIFYGAADSCVCMATTGIDEICTECRASTSAF